MFGGSMAHAAGIVAERSTHSIYVDGQQVQMEAYKINGNNYVKLRDIGKEVGFNVYWLDGVQVDSGSAYTGEAPAAESEEVNIEAIRNKIIARTNALRKDAGIGELTVNAKLMQAAQVRAEEMAASTTYSHTRPDGSKFNTVTDCPYMAENIHRISSYFLNDTCSDLAETAVRDWAASEGHMKNITDEQLGSIGVGIANGVNASGDEAWYCVQLFLYKGQTISWVDKPATK